MLESKSAGNLRHVDPTHQALQLLEFLIKNGSERVIDDARSHLSLLKMLRQFHFIDQNGKDQGLNVRNRAKELAELLSDVDRIRAERKKARATRNKYGGVEGGSSFGSSMAGGGSRYGGFGGNDLSYGGYSGGVYGDGGGFGGNAGDFRDSGSRRDRFEEYDEGDDVSVSSSSRRPADVSHPSRTSTVKEDSSKKKAEPPKPKEPEVDLLSVDDETTINPSKSSASGGANRTTSSQLGSVPSGAAEEDEFDDFQSAAPAMQPASALSQPLPPPSFATSMTQPPPLVAPKPISAGQGSGMNHLVGTSSISPAPSTTSSTAHAPPLAQPAAFQVSQPNYYTSVPVTASQPASSSGVAQTKVRGSMPPTASNPMTNAAKPGPSSLGGDAFGSIWSSASANIKKSSTPTQQGPNLASMAKEKASAGIWGAAAGSSTSQQLPSLQRPVPNQPTAPGGIQKIGGGLDDLLS